ncbi:ABC transporter ATP-binding protein [Brevibacterium samyangense]|uniref:ATP-binding cassette domain-containing protein n=1 Tax=Brevibacterium samyangense TaxID=366888 RepID=A0ABP5F592_9MICO
MTTTSVAPPATTMTGSGLLAENITVTFRSRGRTVTAVDGVTLAVAPGEIVGLVGESGSGKSTVSRVICGLQREYSGTVTYNGAELKPCRSTPEWRTVQMVFQDPYASLDPRYTVRQMLVEVLGHHRIVPRDRYASRCETLMDMVQLPHGFLDRTPARMSGGQRQRIAIARALALEPSVLVADEAVSALDVSVQAEIIRLFAALRDELGLSILFISHDLAVVRNLCDRTAVIHHGVIVEANDTASLFHDPQDDYTKALLRSVPRFSSAFLDSLADD